MKHLFITDLDGTLLNSHSLISQHSAEIISGLSHKGALISIATARTPGTVEPLLQNTFTTPPAVVMTGAAIWDRASQTYIHPQFIDPDSVARINATCLKHGLNPFTYTIQPSGIIHTYFHGQPDNKERRFIDERSHLKLKRIHIIPRKPGKALPVYPNTVLIFSLGQTAQVYGIADELRQNTLCSVSSYPDIFNHHQAYIEIFAPEVNKASAVRQLKEFIGADRMTVFGDNLNDIPMMKIADTAVAVENALPQVKEIADIIIGSNNDDAVARYILEHI